MGKDSKTTQTSAEILEGHTETIVNRWYEDIVPFVPELNTAEVKAQLSESTQQAITLLFTEPFEREIVQAVGGILARNISTEPQFLGRTQKVLAQQFVEGLSPEQASALRPRLTELLGELSVGFIHERDKLTQSMRRKFLSTTSHDMRSPLNAIIGFSRIIMKGVDGPVTETQEQDLTAIYDGGKKLLAMINDIFSIEKIEAGGLELESKTFTVATLADAVVEDVQAMVDENGNKLEVNTAEAPGEMHSDRGKIKQILVNLLSHAARFTRQGTITFTITPDTVAGEDGVRFQISDTGLGMTPAQVQKFVQASDTSTMEYGDIGLMVSQRLCQLLNGELTIESKVNEGSTFTVRLPTGLSTGQ